MDKLTCEIVKGHLFRPLLGQAHLASHTGQAHLSFELQAHVHTFKLMGDSSLGPDERFRFCEVQFYLHKQDITRSFPFFVWV